MPRAAVEIGVQINYGVVSVTFVQRVVVFSVKRRPGEVHEGPRGVSEGYGGT